MSLTAKIAFTGAVSYALGMIYYVHTKQKSDQQKMREGVIKDMERQKHSRKMQNVKMMQDQIELTKILRKEQQEQDDAAEAAQQQQQQQQQ